jgi:hypothetical protein
MKMRRSIAFLVFLSVAFGAAALSPWYASVEAEGDYWLSSRALSCEAQVSCGRNFRGRAHPFLEGGLWTGYEDEEWSNELSLGAGIRPLEWLSIGLSPVFVAGPELDFYLRPSVELSWEFDDAGISVSDVNECSYYVASGEIEYTNDLSCDMSFDISRRASLIPGVSNEFGWSGEVSEEVRVRLGFEARRLGLGLHYAATLAPAVEHAIGIELSYSLDGRTLAPGAPKRVKGD